MKKLDELEERVRTGCFQPLALSPDEARELFDDLRALIAIARASYRLREVGGNFDDAQHVAEVEWFKALEALK